MKPVFATCVAFLGFLASACSVEHSPAPTAQDSTKSVAATVLRLAEVGEPREGDTPARADSSTDNDVRDAKVAAEDAARRIADATLNAASRLREAGVSAIQALREPDHESASMVGGEGDASGEAVRTEEPVGG